MVFGSGRHERVVSDLLKSPHSKQIVRDEKFKKIITPLETGETRNKHCLRRVKTGALSDESPITSRGISERNGKITAIMACA